MAYHQLRLMDDILSAYEMNRALFDFYSLVDTYIRKRTPLLRLLHFLIPNTSWLEAVEEMIFALNGQF